MPDWDRIRRGKDAHRARLATLPMAEKLEIVEKLREQASILRGNRQPPTMIAHVLASGVQVSVPLHSSSATGGAINNLGVFGASQTLFAGVTVRATNANPVQAAEKK